MKYLLDTHVFLWWLNGDKRLQKSTKGLIEDKNNIILVSVVAAWEISIKLSTKPHFKLKTSIKRAFEIAGFEIINITLPHVLTLHELPHYHKDPFDRMLIAQARTENLVLVTDDTKIKQYDVRVA